LSRSFRAGFDSSTRQVTLVLLERDEVPAGKGLVSPPDSPFLLGRDWFVLEQDVFGANRLGRQGRMLGGGGAPDRHVGNSGGEEPIAFYHRVGKPRADHPRHGNTTGPVPFRVGST
jgi:hypothetical protein